VVTVVTVVAAVAVLAVVAVVFYSDRMLVEPANLCFHNSTGMSKSSHYYKTCFRIDQELIRNDISYPN